VDAAWEEIEAREVALRRREAAVEQREADATASARSANETIATSALSAHRPSGGESTRDAPAGGEAGDGGAAPLFVAPRTVAPPIESARSFFEGMDADADAAPQVAKGAPALPPAAVAPSAAIPTAAPPSPVPPSPASAAVLAAVPESPSSSAFSSAPASTQLAIEAARLERRLVQMVVWAEQREVVLRTAAQAQLSALHGEKVKMADELGKRAQEAHAWHGVAEELATENRDESLSRTLAHVRAVRLASAFGAWRRAPCSTMRVPQPGPSASASASASVPATPPRPLSSSAVDVVMPPTPEFDLSGVNPSQLLSD
jgi:hypothetical protein